MGTCGLYIKFGLRYDQYTGHENISIDIVIDILGAIVSVLCSYTVHQWDIGIGEVLAAPKWIPRGYTVSLG